MLINISLFIPPLPPKGIFNIIVKSCLFRAFLSRTNFQFAIHRERSAPFFIGDKFLSKVIAFLCCVENICLHFTPFQSPPLILPPTQKFIYSNNFANICEQVKLNFCQKSQSADIFSYPSGARWDG